MREIKFRCWNPAQKHFEDRFEIGPDGGVGYTNMFETYEYCPDWILQQYTGLKDKNGVEIYEGDIIKTYNGKYEPVFFDKGCYMWAGEPLSIDEEGKFYLPNIWAEVAGNIYQNPELLTA